MKRRYFILAAGGTALWLRFAAAREPTASHLIVSEIQLRKSS